MSRCLLFLVLCGLLSFSSSLAQDKGSYYVTIGVFAKLSNATRLTEKATKQGYNAQYAAHPKWKLNYVYVLVTGDKRKSYALAIKLRVETEYKDAWVFVGSLGAGTDAPEPVVEVPVVEVKPEPVIPAPIVEVKPVEPEPTPLIDSTTITKPIEKPIDKPVVKKPAGKPFYFKLVNSADGTEVKSGEVHVQEAVKATQYQSFKPGDVIYLEAPKNKRGSYTVVTQVPGYSPISTVFNYQDPAGDKGSQDEVVIELPMTKAKRGDYIDFNNVKFFKNASILQPAAQNELDGLVDLMKEDSKYKIKIHGHVNDTKERESFVRGPKSAFFATNPAADKSGRMSAKELSTLRAETVKDYLVSQGISADRISTKGEGGKIPIYPEGGTLGPLNDRVEIEFIRH